MMINDVFSYTSTRMVSWFTCSNKTYETLWILSCPCELYVCSTYTNDIISGIHFLTFPNQLNSSLFFVSFNVLLQYKSCGARERIPPFYSVLIFQFKL